MATCATRPATATDAWSVYQPSRGCYLHAAEGLHGRGHAARVLVWAELLGRAWREDGGDIDLEALRWAAVLHDVRRLHDGHDAAHGERCGDWLVSGGWPHAAALPADRLGRIAHACTWHVPPDAQAPCMTAELLCLKDADALDRVRLGGPDVRLLRTPLARALVGPARFLHATSTVCPGDAWSAVHAAAAAMGLWAPPPGLSVASLCRRLRHCTA